MSEMVERVARAIAERSSDYEGDVLQWWSYRDDARAAIEAMRDPTPDMCVASWDAAGGPAPMYRAMIDAALASEPKP